MEILIIPIAFIMDQWSKDKAEVYLDDGKKIAFGERINLKLIYNKGAFLGFLGKRKTLLWIVSIISLILIVGVGVPVMFLKGAHLMKLGITSMIGGALGNLYDRFKKGRVVDFFSLWFKPNVYMNFADLFVFIGVILFALGTICHKK